jgi:hypothetical protein
MERHDPERGDAGEGTRTLHSDPLPRTYNSTSGLPPVLRTMDIEVGPGGLHTNGENAIVSEQRSRDLFLYCATEHFNVHTMQRFGGACVCINHLGNFFAEVDSALRSAVSLVGDGVLDRCVYAERRQNWHSPVPVHECFIKTHIDLKCPGVLRYCERWP